MEVAMEPLVAEPRMAAAEPPELKAAEPLVTRVPAAAISVVKTAATT